MKFILSRKKLNSKLYRKKNLKITINSEFELLFFSGKTSYYDIKTYEDEKFFNIVIGSIFNDDYNNDNIKYLSHVKDRDIFNIDGDFIYIKYYKKRKSIKIYSHNEGLIPLYYNNSIDSFMITNFPSFMFNSKNKYTLNLSGIYEFLRYGSLIGNNTFFKEIKYLQGGTVLEVNESISKRKLYNFFHKKQGVIKQNINQIMKDIYFSHCNAVKKRIPKESKKVGLMLSGGMDSRYLLSILNDIVGSNNVICFTFGQKDSHEVNVALKVAKVNNNKIYKIELKRKDFIKNADNVSKLILGEDVLVQSYIYDVAKFMSKHVDCFFTGQVIEGHIGNTYFDKKILLNKEEKEYDFFMKNSYKSKMSILSLNEIIKLLPNLKSKIENYEHNIKIEIEENYPKTAETSHASFCINNRVKRLLFHREVLPGFSLDYINPNFDLQLLKNFSKVPLKHRTDRRFYHNLMKKYCDPKLMDIEYHQTKMPLSKSFDLWQKESEKEAMNEKKFEKIMEKHNNKNIEKLYYRHFYSDFNGYLRYDEDWKTNFENLVIEYKYKIKQKLFNDKYLKKIKDDFLLGKNQNRKKLLYIYTVMNFMINFNKHLN